MDLQSLTEGLKMVQICDMDLESATSPLVHFGVLNDNLIK
jgi:hypothetical protein